MALTERKKKVLRSVVDLYIRTAEPVGSKAIAELPDMKYSSATIRNEMAALTELGYLEQPHTSAGRIPSAAGYRLYVDELMADYRLSIDETKSINTAIEEKMQRVDKLVERVAKMVSQATDLPAISMAARQGDARVSRFELIQAGAGSFILVVMLSNDEVVNKLIKLPLNIDETDLKLLSALLNATMTDISVEEFTAAGPGDALRRKCRFPGSGDCGIYHRDPAPLRLRQHGRGRSDAAAEPSGIPEHRQGTAGHQRPG